MNIIFFQPLRKTVVELTIFVPEVLLTDLETMTMNIRNFFHVRPDSFASSFNVFI